ncbi:MAG: BatD family protein [Cyclobacteriaceae bacterium]|jgi:hypothetical protein|nr:BatD family protein [Cyclobacteriaceae bacterium]
MKLEFHKIFIFFSYFFLFFCFATFAQQVQLNLGPEEIGENQMWTITVTVLNDQLKSYDNFPDIDGFKKRGTSSQSSTNIINGQVSSSQSIIMTYMPLRQGVVNVPAFTMTINGTKISSAGKKVKVGAPVQRQNSNDPFSKFFGKDPREEFFGTNTAEFIDVKDDAFFAITTNKDNVYVGEGFTTTIGFYVSESNQASMQFYELTKQLTDIIKKIKPSTCWEEDFDIETIEPEEVEIGGKTYSQYKLYQAVFYPLNEQPITIPSLGLEMIKYKVAKNPSFFGNNRKEDYKTFFSKAKTITVKPLPAHPLKDKVAVGDYRLDEKLTPAQTTTGQSVAYEFNIYGEGNIAGLEKPVIPTTDSVDVYEPNIRQNISRDRGRVTGTKSFSYFLIPKEPGTIALHNYFSWVFFNPVTARYDTLKSNAKLYVTGESMASGLPQETDADDFYSATSTANNNLQTRNTIPWAEYVLYSLAILLVAASIFLYTKKTV